MAEPANVLVIDDDPEYRFALCAMLSHHKLSVRQAGDGWKAMHALRSDPAPDLICVDLMLPGISGFEICEIIRRDERLRDVPILVISARAHPQDVALAKMAGATAYLPKTLRLSELAEHAVAVVRGETPAAGMLPGAR
ncbi:MAG TPA: response regulator [Myxococcales bacterium]|nr:response regulator [Myxococcales bacterium]